MLHHIPARVARS